MLDIVITGGTILDGTGKGGFKGDIAISKGKIVEVSSNSRFGSAHPDQTIDATDRIVSPGFIDVHSHSDLTLLIDPLAQSKVRQGVTTEINGNCGFGVAPIPKENLSEFVKFWKSSGSEWFGIEPDWETFDEYLKVLEQKRPSLNTAVLAAHGSIRYLVMRDAPRKAKDEEISHMERIVNECLAAGACGLSSGLRYSPGCYADISELSRLCKVIRKYGGLYATHMRSEGDNGSWEEAVREAAAIAKDAGVPLQVSHLKALSKNVWNTSSRILKLCDSFKEDGLDLTADQYPYNAAHTGLTVFLPSWITLEEFRCMDPNSRARVLEHIRNVLDVRGGPARIVIISSPDHRFDGKDIAQIGSDLNVSDPGETILKLIEDFTGEISIISRSMIDEDIVKIMKTDYVMIATDGYSISPHGPSAVGIPHPRSYGTYPRVLGHYSRELKLITLEDAVRKMTSLPARKFHLACRGILKEGNWADIVVFDSSTIIDRSTFASPAQYPEGIDYVLVNGAVVVDNKNNSGHTGERAGKVLKLRNGYVN